MADKMFLLLCLSVDKWLTSGEDQYVQNYGLQSFTPRALRS